MKRILALLLVLVMVMGTTSVYAVQVSNTDPQLVDQFVTEVFEMTNKEPLIDLIVLYQGLTDKASFKTAYTAAFGQLTTGEARLASFGVSLDAVDAFAAFIKDVDFSEAALRDYLADDEAGDQAAFEAAILEHEDDFRAAMASVTDLSALDAGFAKMDQLFGFIDNDLLSLKMFNISTINVMTLDTAKVSSAVSLANVVLSDDIASEDEIIAGLGEFVDYFNAAGSTDKDALKTYLKSNDLAVVETSTSGGGGTVTPTPTPTPEVTPTPTPVPEEDTQDAVEEASTVEVEATVTTSESGEVTAEVTVEDTTVDTAISEALTAVAAVEETSTDVEVETVAVFEVTTEEGVEVDEVEVALPLDKIAAAEEDDTIALDAVTVKSEVGSITFDTEAIVGDEEVTADTTLNINMEKVDTTGLDVPEDAVVIDFNISLESKNDLGQTTVKAVKTFAKPILVKVPYTLKATDNPSDITVYYLNDLGESVPVGGRYNTTTGMVEFYIKHFSKYYAAPATKSFADVASAHWAKAYISSLAGKGFITGKTETTFVPSADITRAEFAAIVTRMYKLEGDVTALPFTDVEAGSWYEEAVAGAYASGIIKGRTATTFAPLAKITRQEAAEMVKNALGLENYKVETDYENIMTFSDYADIALWAKPGVATAQREGIIGGRPDGTFDPAGYATRAEVAKMLFMLYNVK